MMQIKMLLIRRLLIFCGIIYFVKGARECPEQTKAHLTRCDMYYRCTVMPSDNIAWMAKTCPNGLVYDTTYKNCVMPGDDWECQLENEGRSSSSDEENVYGVNNLSYLKEQIKGYDTDDDLEPSNEEVETEVDDDKDNVLITMLNNGTLTFESNSSSNALGNEIESSGDGGGPDDQDLEDKSSYIPVPSPANSDKLVASQLQRLSQLIKTANRNHGASDLSPDDLNAFLAQQKLKVKRFHSNKNAVPVPHNKLIDEQHLEQILDLQKKLNNLANNRNTYSTPEPPVKYSVTNGYYPADATTVHIKATNGLKNPEFPNVGAASSQIVVNRPGGSVVFRLPYSNPPTKKVSEKKPNDQISAETLKMILELTKHMSNQAPNTPQFVHSPPAPPSTYAQPMPPIVQPILYNIPWDQITAPSLLQLMNSVKSDKIQSDESMEKISTVSGSIPAATNTASEADDIGPTTIIHNHIPITVSQPNPTNSIVNRIQNPTTTTTMRPILSDRYDSYGNKRPAEHTDLNEYYPYPPYFDGISQNQPIQQMSPVPSTSSTYSSPYSTQQTYNENVGQPHYIKIAQSRPDHYMPQQYPNNAIMHNAAGPIPTFVSVNGGYTNKVFSTYAPQPHLGDGNVNDFVQIDHNPYPTLRPTNYVPIATASSPTVSYAEPPESFSHMKKQKQNPHIFDKVDRFDNEPNDIVILRSESNDNLNNSKNSNNDNNNNYNDSDSNEDDYVNSNVEQDNNDDSNENVMTLLANYNSQIKPSSKTTPMTIDDGPMLEKKKSKNQYKAVHGQASKHKQFVSLNGNFLSMETYQQSIEPFLNKNSDNLPIQVLTCATGVRQPNTTDCTRYFVCNEQTGKILSYKCPPYTAFNANIKLCNGDTYVKCFSSNGMSNEIEVPDADKIFHQKIQQDIIEAGRLKAEAQKAHQLAQLLKFETDKILHSTHYKQQVGSSGKSTPSIIPPTRPSFTTQKRPHRKPQTHTSHSSNLSTKQKPSVQQTNTKIRGKRKIPCKQEGKLADNLSIHHYFLCFNDQTNTMRARRMECPAKLIFCPNTLVCTATERCSTKFG